MSNTNATPIKNHLLQNGRTWWIVAAFVVVALVFGLLAWNSMRPVVPASLAQASSQPTPPTSQPASTPSTSASDPASATSPTATPVPVDLTGRVEPAMTRPPQAQPAELTVSSVGISTDLETLGLLDDGSLATPVDTDLAGWYNGGPKPGAVGPAVIAGHVSYGGGPSVFFHLSEIVAGDKITVTQEDGSEVNFRVTRVEQHAKDDFPTLEVYGNTATPELRLITCGGDVNESSGHFYDNVIVFAQME
ncbi:class F sortase [Demequina oxidasica]|uniref:class F sortase n=1 Tax=Demequina oxidasica TaxID=676199 RepID=UPI000783BDA5|nr:class F sortase [Demequina oxidasica]